MKACLLVSLISITFSFSASSPKNSVRNTGLQVARRHLQVDSSEEK